MKNKINKLSESSGKPVDILTPQDEYERKVKKNKAKDLFFALFLVVQCVVCAFGVYIVKKANLHYRVTKELENIINNEIVFTNGTYVGETEFGYFAGEGIYFYNSGSLYQGQWSANQIAGVGILKVPSEGRYEGEFLNSEKSGNGVFTWDDGTVYNGEWKNDQMTGKGLYVTSSAIKYDGIFNENKFKEGKCTFSNETGDYVVEYKEFAIENINILFVDKTSYTGSCDGKSLSGNGTMIFPNGDKYVGEFSESRREGKGVYTWKNGETYDGNWHDDEMSGKGKYVFLDGSYLQGTFSKNGFNNGSYNLTNSFGEYSFTIKNSKVVSVYMKLVNGTTYSGDMVDGVLTGTAQITYSNGDKYNGHVENGYKYGQGKYTWQSGASYDGEWIGDKMNGRGTYYYPESSNGYKLTGDFLNGVPVGQCNYYVSASKYYKTDWSNGRCVKVYE